MAEAIDKPLERLLIQSNNTYFILFKRGTTVKYWHNEPNLVNFLTLRKPDYMVISLGTNDLFVPKKNSDIIGDLDLLIRYAVSMGVEKNKILIIATPLQNDNGLNVELRNHFGNSVFPSQQLQLVLKADGIHPTPASNEQWSKAIMSYLEQLGFIEND